MNFIERVMRAMTHLNIGAALGLVAWVLWSGWQLVTGQIVPAHRPAEIRVLMSLLHAGHPLPTPLVPRRAADGPLPPCHEPQPVERPAAATPSGADL